MGLGINLIDISHNIYTKILHFLLYFLYNLSTLLLIHKLRH